MSKALSSQRFERKYFNRRARFLRVSTRLIAAYFMVTVSTAVAIVPMDLKPINIYDSEETATYPVFRGALEIGQKSSTEPKFHDFQGLKNVAGFHYVYARDYIFMLDLKNQPSGTEEVRYSQAVHWKSDNRSVSLCKKKGQSHEKCKNFVKVFEEVHRLRSDGASRRMVACATNAFNPTCRYYELARNGKLTYMNQEFAGSLKCPFDPSHGIASMMSGSNLYISTQAGFNGHDSLLHRSSIDRDSRQRDTNLRTIRGDATWLNAPQFVRFVDGGQSLNKVFSFFSEVAIEDKSYQVYSRVGQVCKNDQGGHNMLRNQFSSFFKARLNCSLPGKPPFYFNEIRDVTDLVTLNNEEYRIGNTKVVFAIMNTPRNSIPASAVCVFTLPDIEAAMSGPFLEKYIAVRSSQSYWAKQNNYPSKPHLSSCQREPRRLTDKNFNFVRKHPIMYNSVNAWNMVDNLTNHHNAFPLYSRANARNFLTALAVDTAAGIHGTYTVLISGTEDGKIIKVLLIGKREPVVIEERAIFSGVKCGKANKSVLSITLDKPTGSMLVAFKNCIIRAPLCQLNTTCESKCIQSRDPYCAWDGMKCITVDRQYSSNSTSGTQPRQDVLEGNVIGLADCNPTAVGSEISSDIPIFQPHPPAEVAQNSKSNANTSLLRSTAPVDTVIPLAKSASTSWLYPALVALFIGLLLGIFVGVMFCAMQKKLCSPKLMMGEKHKIVQTTIPNGGRRDSNQSGAGRSSSKPRHSSTGSQGKKRTSTHEETRRKRQITETSLGSRSEEDSTFLPVDLETTPTTPSHDVPDAGRSKQIKSTSSSQGGRRRNRDSKPSTSSGPENSEERRSASQKRHPPIPPGEGPPAYEEGISPLPGDSVDQIPFQGSDSRFSSESLKTPLDSDRMFPPNAGPTPQKVRPGPARSMSFQLYNPHPNMSRTHSVDNHGANTVGHARPRGINRQRSLQVADTMPIRYQQQPMYVTIPSQEVPPNVPPSWVNQTPVTNSASPSKTFDNRHGPIAHMTHSLDRRKMLKGQTQYQLPPNEIFDDQTHPQVVDSSNGYPSRKRYMSENAGLSENNARMAMSRPAHCQPIHEEHESVAYYQIQPPRKDPKVLKQNLFLDIAPNYNGVHEGFGGHSAPVQMSPQVDPNNLGPRRGPHPTRPMIAHSNPGTPMRGDMPPGFDQMLMSNKAHATLPLKQKSMMMPHQKSLPEQLEHKMYAPQPEGSPTKSNPSTPMHDGRPPSFPNDRRRNYSGQGHVQALSSPVRTMAPVSFGTATYYPPPPATSNDRTRHQSGGNSKNLNGHYQAAMHIAPEVVPLPFSQPA